ncbi:uracil-DNA glycosylase [Kordiimonas sp. SCSIO 12610]|uniref:uracil-DNA glycosylase n=1 Tax=Kordiimonas sp. SCSIO 12610 TaxID=2829597 RepID=UPI00210C01B9|nr:uracil-DNA glycosylase [Kordiimonas sp. SCSIO 12610]UTW56483.1 uracil-DNA glycosylase [Kordiimonas sp. SCSIO 12610]
MIETFEQYDDLTMLEWLIAAGADEAIGDEPVNRFEAANEVRSTEATPQQANQASTFQPQSSLPKSSLPKSTPRPVAPQPVSSTHGAGFEAATAVANAASTLEDLKAAMEAFDGGLLKRSAKNTVFADGVAGSDLMVIGEAPGADEDQLGKPFVGVSGQLLDKMLAAIGRSRETNTYISNIVPWRPLGNRTPDQAIITMCMPFIKRHIELAKPKVILMLGGVAAKSLLESDDGITRLRGKWRDLTFSGQKYAAIPTYHPAYLLRQPAQKGMAWRDLLSIKEKLSSDG